MKTKQTEIKQREKRKLQALNLLDDFLFGTMVSHPIWGEPFSRLLLETIFQERLGKFRVEVQKTYYGKDTDRHGTRLDVYLEELPGEAAGQASSIYDMEPNRRNSDLKEISRRTRFYHALIDADCLKSGAEYAFLKNVIVILIMPDDPFGAGRMVYTVRNYCAEEPDLPYDDGAQTIFLYTRGTEGNPSKELRELLCYIENSVEENAVNEDLRRLHQMVEAVKQNREVELDYMKYFEEAEEHREEGRAEERRNTERERQRAEAAEQRAETAEERTKQEKQRADRAEIDSFRKGKIEALLQIVEMIEPIPGELREKIMAVTDARVLEKWIAVAFQAKSMEEFMERIER